MTKSSAFRFLRQMLPGSAAAMGLLCSFGLASPARAINVTLCPSAGVVGGFGYTTANVVGPLDGTCGTDSAVQISLTNSTTYGKLTFSAGAPPSYPAGLTLGNLLGLSANVSFTSNGGDQPYFELAFTDASQSLGQSSATDQILMIELQPSTLSGTTLAADPNSTKFNLYDNTTGGYLQGGQPATKTINSWLSTFASLNSESVQEIRIGMGLTGSNIGAESMTINSLSVSQVPEPASLALLSVALLGIGISRRRRAS